LRQHKVTFQHSLAPAGMSKRRHLPLWKCCKVFSFISSYSKTPSRRIIYALVSQSVVGLEASTPDPHRGSIPGLRWGTFVPRPLICIPLEKILRAPMPTLCHFRTFGPVTAVRNGVLETATFCREYLNIN